MKNRILFVLIAGMFFYHSAARAEIKGSVFNTSKHYGFICNKYFFPMQVTVKGYKGIAEQIACHEVANAISDVIIILKERGDIKEDLYCYDKNMDLVREHIIFSLSNNEYIDLNPYESALEFYQKKKKCN